MSVNKAILIGNLGGDPELSYTPSGKAVCKYSIATSEKWKKDDQWQEKTVWHNIVAWGGVAEIMKEHLVKGKKVYIEGKIDNRSYENKDGETKWVSEVVVSNFQFLDPKDSGPKTDAAPVKKKKGKPAPPPVDDDDDLPF